MIITAYMVLCGSMFNGPDKSTDLTMKVTRAIEKGWQPYGSMNDMCQPMVKSREGVKVIEEYLK